MRPWFLDGYHLPPSVRNPQLPNPQFEFFIRWQDEDYDGGGNGYDSSYHDAMVYNKDNINDNADNEDDDFDNDENDNKDNSDNPNIGNNDNDKDDDNKDKKEDEGDDGYGNGYENSEDDKGGKEEDKHLIIDLVESSEDENMNNNPVIDRVESDDN